MKLWVSKPMVCGNELRRFRQFREVNLNIELNRSMNDFGVRVASIKHFYKNTACTIFFAGSAVVAQFLGRADLKASIFLPVQRGIREDFTVIALPNVGGA